MRAGQAVEGDAARVEYQKWICETKRAFDSRLDASIAAELRIVERGAPPALYAYRCIACTRWHLTKQANGEPVAFRPGWRTGR